MGVASANCHWPFYTGYARTVLSVTSSIEDYRSVSSSRQGFSEAESCEVVVIPAVISKVYHVELALGALRQCDAVVKWSPS